ncbi:MAG: tripartite tricarboxylate transporter substrate binding protein [Burkholderiaceae bacterium]|nr:tripartite tricarboxylate transporter substrate binding protein [Burkholderiaceae bacterium]
MNSRTSIRLALTAGLALVLTLGHSLLRAQAYPSQPIRLIVPYAAGTNADGLARQLAPRVSAILGQQLIVDNRPGAGAIIGTEMVVRAAPDGYTLLFGATQTAINISLYKKLPYDTLRDLAPVVRISNQPQAVVINAALPPKSIPELVEYAKKNPGKLNYANTGVGNSGHLANVYFAHLAGIDMKHVSYNNFGKLLTDMLRGDIHMLIYPLPGVSAQIDAGKLRPLATTGEKRVSFMAQLPTMVELGYKDLVLPAWQGIFAPARTPPAVMDTIYRAFAQVLNDPQVQSKMLESGTEVALENPVEFGKFIRSQAAIYEKMVKISGATAE